MFSTLEHNDILSSLTFSKTRCVIPHSFQTTGRTFSGLPLRTKSFCLGLSSVSEEERSDIESRRKFHLSTCSIPKNQLDVSIGEKRAGSFDIPIDPDSMLPDISATKSH